MMIFQGEPFDDEDYDIAVDNISNAVIKYNPNLMGTVGKRFCQVFKWSHKDIEDILRDIQ